MNYYIADCHFGHSAVLRFDHRPFGSVEEMEEVMVMNWNATVNPKDTVYILGDFCWGKADEWRRILRRLKGSKVLILGNHDLSQYPPELRKEFADIKDYKEIVDNGYGSEGRKVILSHYPMPFFKHSNNRKYFMLHGHIHNTTENAILDRWIAGLRQRPEDGASIGQVINVGCMMPYMHYCPRTLDEIIRGREGYLKRIDMMNGGVSVE